MTENKVFIIGVDGMDPRMTRRMVDEGKLPNIKKLIEIGSARKDLVLLGAVPTITPPMWTTLATGAYPATHGITDYWNPHPTELDTFVYAFDSHQCKAEQVWNCIAEAGKKVLVWDWPGASWPPSSDSENLHVVAGLGPVAPNMANCSIDKEVITIVSPKYKAIGRHGVQAEIHGGAGCIMEVDTSSSSKAEEDERPDLTGMSGDIKAWLCFDHYEGEEIAESPTSVATFDVPIKTPKRWTKKLPKDALEFSVIVKNGLRQLPSLLLKGEDGAYDHLEIYMSKKDAEPWVILSEEDNYVPVKVMEINKDGEKINGTRSVSLMEFDPDNFYIKISMGDCLDITTSVKEDTWSPKSLYQQTVNIAGYCPVTSITGGGTPDMISRRYLPSWSYMHQWQAKALLGLIEQNDYSAVFTHIHSVDHLGHACWRWAKSREKYNYNDEKLYQSFLEAMYIQVDEYVKSLMPLLDKEWTLILVSDHGLLCSEEDEIPYLGEAFMMNVLVMEKLGYTVLKKDENGNRLRQIDWEKTRAVAPRGNHIYINLKGRNPHGIVDPKDKYELERKIIDDLYNYRENGKRIISLAIRNKDAKVLGFGGDRCGDIIYFLEEGFNRLHGDSLPTTEGYFDTSVSPIFVAAGKGVKSGYEIKRQIREVDVAPTVAAILNVRLPENADGAVIHQILA